jgi:hypothetical protein
MKNKKLQKYGVLAIGLILSACTEGNFSSQQAGQPAAQPKVAEQKAKTPEAPAPVASAAPAAEPGKCDRNQDKFKKDLSPTSPIVACMNAKKLYDFDKVDGSCLGALAAVDPCTTESFNARVQALGMSAKKILDKYPTAVVIGCGQKRQGKTLLGQWWVPNAAFDEEKCEMTEDYMILTACFELDDSGKARPEPRTEAEVRAAVLACTQI